jgi:hypothetical protein
VSDLVYIVTGPAVGPVFAEEEDATRAAHRLQGLTGRPCYVEARSVNATYAAWRERIGGHAQAAPNG